MRMGGWMEGGFGGTCEFDSVDEMRTSVHDHEQLILEAIRLKLPLLCNLPSWTETVT